MTAISQGLKAGLAAGVIYGLMIGLLHLTTLLGCSSTQIQFISQHTLPSNTTASDIFYYFDIVYYPMLYGSLTLIFGVIFGLIFGFMYWRLPGSTSKTKGLTIGAVVFVLDAIAGPGFFTEYSCGGSSLPYLTFALSVPAALIFGSLLGSFYDRFGRLEEEETEERKKEEPQHWSEAFRRKKPTSDDDSDKQVTES